MIFVESSTKLTVLCSMFVWVVVGRPVNLVNILWFIRVCRRGILLVYMVYSRPDILLPCIMLQLREFLSWDLHVSISTNCLRLLRYDLKISRDGPLMP